MPVPVLVLAPFTMYTRRLIRLTTMTAMVLSMADQRASHTSSGWVRVVFVTMTRTTAKTIMITPRPTMEPMAIFSARERLTTQSSFQGRTITADLGLEVK